MSFLWPLGLPVGREQSRRSTDREFATWAPFEFNHLEWSTKIELNRFRVGFAGYRIDRNGLDRHLFSAEVCGGVDSRGAVRTDPKWRPYRADHSVDARIEDKTNRLLTLDCSPSMVIVSTPFDAETGVSGDPQNTPDGYHVERLADVECLIIDDTGQRHDSSGLAGYLADD